MPKRSGNGFGRKETDEKHPHVCRKRRSKQVAATLDSAVEPRRSSRLRELSNRRNDRSEGERTGNDRSEGDLFPELSNRRNSRSEGKLNSKSEGERLGGLSSRRNDRSERERTGNGRSEGEHMENARSEGELTGNDRSEGKLNSKSEGERLGGLSSRRNDRSERERTGNDRSEGERMENNRLEGELTGNDRSEGEQLHELSNRRNDRSEGKRLRELSNRRNDRSKSERTGNDSEGERMENDRSEGERTGNDGSEGERLRGLSNRRNDRSEGKRLRGLSNRRNDRSKSERTGNDSEGERMENDGSEGERLRGLSNRRNDRPEGKRLRGLSNRRNSRSEGERLGGLSNRRNSRSGGERLGGLSNRRNSRSEGKLSSNKFECYLEDIWRKLPEDKKNSFACLDSSWFGFYRTEQYKSEVLRWIKNKDIFSKKYVFVPIILWAHWCLLIFCHLGESLESESTPPCMLLLDSLQSAGSSRFAPEIRKFVSSIFISEERPENQQLINKIPLLVPQVPQQRNATDCGKFVLYYISLFLESAPETFSISEGYPYFMKKDWFTPDQLESFWQQLQTVNKDSSSADGNSSDSYEVMRIN